MIIKGFFCEAHSNENGTGLDGRAGDQTGLELRARNYYNNGWTLHYRPIDENVADKIATFMEKCVTNGFIGYDLNRNKRGTLFQALEKVDFEPDLINTPVHCDCSSLAYCAIYSVLRIPFKPIIDSEIHAPKTLNFPSYLDKECQGHFISVSGDDAFYEQNLIRGDILLKITEDGTNHTAIWV